LWERLGACTHALRINALLTVHRSSCLAMPLSALLRGAMVNANVRTVGNVLLRPAAVLQVRETFGADLLSTVSDVATRRDWVRGFESSSVLWTPICLNATGGVGVDIFFALHLEEGGTVVVTDQRKRVAKRTMSPSEIATLVGTTPAAPSCVGEAREGPVSGERRVRSVCQLRAGRCCCSARARPCLCGGAA
jgi:hypothetical protein